MDWKVLYDDGSEFTSNDGPPESAPSLGVQMILQRSSEEGFIPLWEKDYYWFNPDTQEWMCGNLFGLFDFLINHTSVVFGRSMRTPQFQAMKQRALKDPDFPPKSRINYQREEWE